MRKKNADGSEEERVEISREGDSPEKQKPEEPKKTSYEVLMGWLKYTFNLIHFISYFL